MECEEGLNTVPFVLVWGKMVILIIMIISTMMLLLLLMLMMPTKIMTMRDDEQTMMMMMMMMMISLGSRVNMVVVVHPSIFQSARKKKKTRHNCLSDFYDSIRQGTSAVCGHREWFRELVRRLGSTGEIIPERYPPWNHRRVYPWELMVGKWHFISGHTLPETNILSIHILYIYTHISPEQKKHFWRWFSSSKGGISDILVFWRVCFFFLIPFNCSRTSQLT